jgi:hypothetical protein
VEQSEEIETGEARARFEIAARAAGEVQDLKVLVGDDIGRRVALGGTGFSQCLMREWRSGTALLS